MVEPGTVRLSFRDAQENPFVILYNPAILSFPLRTQLLRFGLIAHKTSHLEGNLKGKREDLIEMINTYGHKVGIVTERSEESASH